jgi:hypothetical protein
MRNLFFWHRWPRPERTLFNFAVLVFLVALAGMAWYYVTTPSPVIRFQTVTETELAEHPAETFRQGAFNLAVPVNHYTVTERQLGTPLEPNVLASYLWLACFAICVTGLLAVVTTASTYYYFAAMGIFILLVVSLKMETLLLFGREDKIFSIGVMIAYGLGSFHIYYFLPGLKFAARFLYFAAVTIVVAAFIYFFAEAEFVGLHLATYSFQAGMIACVLFIVTVAHEILAAFIAILTRTTRSGKTLNHFLIITLIYLVNLVIAYSVKFGFIGWNIITVNLYLLLALSGILGLWGLRQRQNQMEGIIDVEPHALTGFVFLGGLAFGAIAWFLGTANDPAYNAIADLIIFSHLGYGFIFVMYVMSNFGGMLSQNMAVHKVLYSPKSMPFFTFRLAGLIATLALVIYNTWQVPAHNAVAGFQNMVGDLYLMEENTRVAAVYYDQGRTYGYSNHHSNYALANLAGMKFDHAGEKNFYKAASYLRPTEMSYLNWAQMLQSENNPRDAINILTEGLERFPESDALSNSLGLLLAADGNSDSAALVFDKTASAQSNMIALAARQRLPLLADTTHQNSDSPAMMANKLAFALVSGRKSGVPLILPGDSSINASEAAYINNYLANYQGNVDTVMLRRIETLARMEVNAGLSEPLLFACAISWYSRGEVQKAFMLMEEVAITSANKGKYNHILALWSLDQDDALRAKKFVDFALSQDYEPAFITNAVTLTESLNSSMATADDIRMAVAAWDSLMRVNDSTLVNLARNMTYVLNASISSVASLSEEDQYAFARYRMAADTAGSIRILRTLNPDLQANGLLELSQRMLDLDNLAGAAAVIRLAMTLPVKDATLKDDVRLHDLLLMTLSENRMGLQNLESPSMDLSGKRAPLGLYFEALRADASGDTVRIKHAYQQLAKSSWFFAEGILASAKHFEKHPDGDMLRSYKLLADAIQHHPSSVRLRKAYIREAKRIGFDDYAEQGMEELKSMLPEAEYRKFAAEGQ